MTRARDLADSADKDITGTLTVDGLDVSGSSTFGTPSGDTRFNFDGANQYRAVFKNGGTVGGQIGAGGADDLRFSNAAGATVATIKDGNVGIGTTPDRDLHVKGASGDPVHFKLEGDASDYARIMFDDGTTDNIGELRYNFGSDYMSFNTNSAERMRLDSSGNVGIGTAAPAVNAHVQTTSGNPQIRVESTGANYVTYSLKNSVRQYSAQIRTDQSNAFVIRDETGGGNRLLIDTSGRVTTPYQPHFCAVGPASNNTYNTAPVTNYLTAMKYNTGGHYHTSGANAGKFIAPVTGTYLFYFGAFHNSAVTGRVSLVVNSNLITNPYISGHSSGMGAGYSASTGVALQNLAAGDAVQWGVSSGSIYAYGGHTAFGGYLLG